MGEISFGFLIKGHPAWRLSKKILDKLTDNDPIYKYTRSRQDGENVETMTLRDFKQNYPAEYQAIIDKTKKISYTKTPRNS